MTGHSPNRLAVRRLPPLSRLFDVATKPVTCIPIASSLRTPRSFDWARDSSAERPDDAAGNDESFIVFALMRLRGELSVVDPEGQDGGAVDSHGIEADATSLGALGTLHLHILGARSLADESVREALRRLGESGRPFAAYPIAEHTAGEQRVAPYAWLTYWQYQMPSGPRFYSTHLLRNRTDAIASARTALDALVGTESILEVERIMGSVEDHTWSEVPARGVERLSDADVGVRLASPLPIKVRHVIEVFVEGSMFDRAVREALSPARLVTDLPTGMLAVGAWLRLERADQIALRSVSFLPYQALNNLGDLQATVVHAHAAVATHFARLKLRFRLRTFVEEVLCLCRT